MVRNLHKRIKASSGDMLFMTQESPEATPLEDYSFLRRFLSLTLAGYTVIVGIIAVIATLVLILVIIFPFVIFWLSMAFAYSVGDITYSITPVLFTIPIAALAATFYGRSSGSRILFAIGTYAAIIVGTPVIFYVLTADQYDNFPTALPFWLTLALIGPLIYLNSSPEAVQQRELKRSKATRAALELIPKTDFSSLESWLKEQNFSKDDPRNNPKLWTIAAYRDATLYMAPKGSSKEVLMTRNGRVVSFKDNENRDNEYTTSYEVLWED